jgi:hypothetical protein
LQVRELIGEQSLTDRLEPPRIQELERVVGYPG